MADQKLPPALTSDGMIFASLDGIIGLSLVLIKHFPHIKDDICAMLRERFANHQKLVDERGLPANVNAAAVLRLIMVQIGCEDIPDHQ